MDKKSYQVIGAALLANVIVTAPFLILALALLWRAESPGTVNFALALVFSVLGWVLGMLSAMLVVRRADRILATAGPAPAQEDEPPNMLSRRRSITMRWWAADKGAISDQERLMLEEDGEEHILGQMRDGYGSGRLSYETNDGSFYFTGWWSSSDWEYEPKLREEH